MRGWKQKRHIYVIGNWNKLMYTRIARREAWLIWIEKIVFRKVLKNSIENSFFKQVYNYSELVCFIFCGQGISYIICSPK